MQSLGDSYRIEQKSESQKDPRATVEQTNKINLWVSFPAFYHISGTQVNVEEIDELFDILIYADKLIGSNHLEMLVLFENGKKLFI